MIIIITIVMHVHIHIYIFWLQQYKRHPYSISLTLSLTHWQIFKCMLTSISLVCWVLFLLLSKVLFYWHLNNFLINHFSAHKLKYQRKIVSSCLNTVLFECLKYFYACQENDFKHLQNIFMWWTLLYFCFLVWDLWSCM